MAKHRQLDASEKKVISSSLLSLKEDEEYLDCMVRKGELNLELAPLIYRQQFKQMQIEHKKMKDENEVVKNTIKTLERQLREGVEIKNEQTK